MIAKKKTLDKTKILERLSTPCRLEVYKSVGSTNDVVFELAQKAVLTNGAKALLEPFVVISAVQTLGRGRLGRSWDSPAGGLYLSMLFGTKPEINKSAQIDAAEKSYVENSLASLSPLVALAASECLQEFSQTPLLIKWPNDIVTHSGKIAGILAERKMLGGQGMPDELNEHCLVVGIGVNTRRPDSNAISSAAYLDDTLQENDDSLPAIEVVAAALVQNVMEYFYKWQEGGFSFAPFVARYLKHMSQIGSEVSVWDLGGKEIASGIVVGVSDDGQIILEDKDKKHLISAGEITMRPPQ